MSSLGMRHPGELALLEYLDGEVPKRQARKIQGHLEACWQCRVELEELQSTVNRCVRYRKQVLVACVPEPPMPWGTLDFASVDAKIATESMVSRALRWLSPWQNVPLRWALSGAMVLALTVATVRHLRETPNVEAAILLQKAVAAADARPHSAKRLRIVTASRSLTRVVGGASVRAAAEESEIARLFESAHYDWNDPLSAKSYAAWHDALVQKVDEIASTDPDTYSIKTTTTGSELVSATLKIRKSGLAPLEGRFEFRNHEWVEMTELVDQLSPGSIVAGAAGGTSRQPDVPPGPSSLPSERAASGARVSANEELQVVAALHRLGADLGDPLEIAREGRDVVVSGTGLSPQRKQQIHAVLDRLPHVAVRFSDPIFPAGTPAQSEPATARDAAAPERQKYTAQLELRLGGRPQFERFSGQLLDWTDSAMARAYALRRLAQQFSQYAEGAMNAEDRRTLHTLGSEHLAALQNDLNRIRTTLNPVLGDSAAARAPHETAAAGAWQAQTEQVLASSRRMETLLATVLGVTQTAASADAPAQLLAALGQLSAEIEHCQRLLSYD